MKKAAQTSLTFFVLAILFAFFSIQTNASEKRLLVGIFIVLGMAFMIYSFKEYIRRQGFLLFKDKTISQKTLIKPSKGEFYVQENTQYLWIENTILLQYSEDASYKRFFHGVAYALSLEKYPETCKPSYVFQTDQEGYLKEKKLRELLEAGLFDILENKDAHTYYAKEALWGVRLTKGVGILLVAFLFIYVALQII